ncbi:MAG: hypothetical protein ACFB10_17980 [Salibacteraceae bacterium]
MGDELVSKKKKIFPITPALSDYLVTQGRTIKMPIFYDDLLRFSGTMEIYDDNGQDTLWVNCIYAPQDIEEINQSLKRVYSILHADGSDSILPYLTIDSICYCTFGNTRPFRVKVRNIINDNYIFLYIKRADASRIYGLELEHLLSPNLINFLVYRDTLIEEHIIGIPGDVFIEQNLKDLSQQDQRALAKEFVKFNERCFIRLLADMRSYNYVIVITQDFDRVQYRIRAIDFDQQSYEGNSKVYKPQFLKENNALVEMTLEVLPRESIDQYIKEERSLLAKRATSESERLFDLMRCMQEDTLSLPEKVRQLKTDLYDLTKDVNFKKSKRMGHVVQAALDFVIRNYNSENPFIIR